ncbi:methyltransferase domain-containing protein [bacterium]|nr:methyltransferase domain-containing protein [bacterium]
MQLADVSRNYDFASRYYDSLTEIVFGWILGLEKLRSRTVDLLGDIEGATVLDLGCGTGRNFSLLTAKVGKHGKIVGVDYSAGMLEKAAQRIRKNNWQNIELIRGDAAQLEGISGPFDAVVAIWVLGIVYDLEAAIVRVTELMRPGGIISILDFGKSRPDRGLLRWLFPLYSMALKCTGIDSAEDLDSAKLEVKWARGKEVLRKRLAYLEEDHYLDGAGLILSGQKLGQTTEEPAMPT